MQESSAGDTKSTIATDAGSDSTGAAQLHAMHSDHWKHVDQIRQWLLYNFLMTGSITILAWAAVYGQNTYLSVALSIFGVMLSCFWFLIANRASGYYYMYEDRCREIEKAMPNAREWPFHSREVFRARLKWWQKTPAAILFQGVPILFGFFFLLITILEPLRRVKSG